MLVLSNLTDVVDVTLSETGGSDLNKPSLLSEFLQSATQYLQVKSTAVAHAALDAVGESAKHMLKRSHVRHVALNTFGSEGLRIEFFLAGSFLLRHVSVH